MARTKISEFSATPSDNTDIDGIDIAEGCAPSGINNAIRELMAQLKDMQTGASGDTFTLTTVNSTTVDTTNLEATNLKAKDGTAAGSIANSTGVVTLGSSVLTTTDINGGTVDGTTIGATTPSTVVATQVDITAQGDLRLQDTTGGQYVALQAPGTIATSYTLTLPVDDGTAGQALITDGSGVLSWSTAASGDVYGPASATDNAVARYDGTTGKIIQNSAVTIGDDGATVIAANSSSDGLRITQTGAGNALLVEDSANPDATPFVVNASGQVSAGFASNPVTMFGSTPQLGVHTTGNDGLANYRGGNDVNGAGFIFQKTRGANPGVNTVVQSGDNLGVVYWTGADGTGYIRGAEIAGQVDGTPGTNDMPGRLVFSTTADGASSPTERMRIRSDGNIGIGDTGAINFKLKVSGTYTTGANTSLNVIRADGTVPSTATAGAAYFASVFNQAAGFTLPIASHFSANQGTFSGTVTNQYGFEVNSSLTGATNNYGFYSNIASGTGRWNFYAAGTAANYFAGSTAIGTTTTNTGYGSAVSLNLTNGASVTFNNASNAWNNSTAGGGITYFVDNNLYIDAKDSTSRVFFRVNGLNTRGEIASNGTWSLGAISGAESLRVTPVASAVNYLNVQGNATTGAPILSAQGSDTNINVLLLSKGTGGHVFTTGSVANPQFVISNTTSAVNYLQVTGGATGGGATLSAQGSDTNVSMQMVSKGTGVFRFTSSTGADSIIRAERTGATSSFIDLIAFSGSTTLRSGGAYPILLGTNGGVTQLAVAHTASAVNYLQATGGVTGDTPKISAQGSDTNIDLSLSPKGTGVLLFGTYTAGVVAQAGYITIKDAGGTTRRLLVG